MLRSHVISILQSKHDSAAINGQGCCQSRRPHNAAQHRLSMCKSRMVEKCESLPSTYHYITQAKWVNMEAPNLNVRLLQSGQRCYRKYSAKVNGVAKVKCARQPKSNCHHIGLGAAEAIYIYCRSRGCQSQVGAQSSKFDCCNARTCKELARSRLINYNLSKHVAEP